MSANVETMVAQKCRVSRVQSVQECSSDSQYNDSHQVTCRVAVGGTSLDAAKESVRSQDSLAWHVHGY